MGELGTRLREAREALGLSLEQAEDLTRIRRVFLQALEEERFADLPGDVYVRGFVRNYAQALKLDADELLAIHGFTHKATVTPRAPLVLNEPLVRTGSSFARRLFLALVAVVLVGLGGWAAYSYYGLGTNPLASLQSLWVTRTSGGPAVGSTTPVTTPQITPQAGAQTPEATATPTQIAPTAMPTVTRQPTRTPTRARTPTVDPALSGAIVVEAEFTAPTYVDVVADGERLYVGTLTEGDRQTWTADTAISLRVGNAGGLTLQVNGIQVPPLGASGEVVDVEYNLENLPTE
ncbi:MAG: helix-turn-helix domain-containing protein [Anaerolineae bacterium]